MTNNEKNEDTNKLICVKTYFVDCFMGPGMDEKEKWMSPEQLISTLLSNMYSTAYTMCSSLEECLALNPGKEELVRNTYMEAERRREEIRNSRN